MAESRFSQSRVGERIDAVIDAALITGRIVGAVVLVNERGRPLYHRAAGMADREAGRAMTRDARFRLASVSKPLVATAAMALVAQGRLELDAPIARWLPEFQPRGPHGEAVSISLRQLMSHQSGLGYGFLEAEDGPYRRAGVSDGIDLSELTLAENLSRLSSVPLRFLPGEDWCYSLGVDVLGGIIERVTGAPLAEAMRELVTGPLGLTTTGFAVDDPSLLTAAYADAAPAARRMENDDRVPVLPGLAHARMDPRRALDPRAFASGGAGMVGAAPDVLRFLEALRTDELLPEAVRAEMGRSQTGDLGAFGWPGRSFGLAATVLTDPTSAGTPEPVGAWRWGGAWGHSWLLDPSNGIAMVAFTNTALEGMSGGGRFPEDLIRALYG